jgi:hypothetical protein
MQKKALPIAVFAVVCFLALPSVTAMAAEPATDTATEPATDAPAGPPPNRVVVMYYHRTARCATCEKMGGYAEEAVKEAFAEQMASGTVEFHTIDYQAAKNAALTKGYHITGPSLIIAKAEDNKVAKYKNLKEIWDKVSNKAAFFEYVQEHVKEYLP